MTTKELIEAIAKCSGITNAQAKRALKCFEKAIAIGLKHQEKVSLVGFGTFSVKTRASRSGRNPKTGEAITIPASRSVNFKAGKALKNSVF